MASRSSRGSTAAALRAVPESVGVGKQRFSDRFNALYREGWRLALAASDAQRQGDEETAMKHLASLHDALGIFLEQS